MIVLLSFSYYIYIIYTIYIYIIYIYIYISKQDRIVCFQYLLAKKGEGGYVFSNHMNLVCIKFINWYIDYHTLHTPGD